MAFRTERTANVRSLHTAHVGPRRTDVRSLTCSCLVRRVDEGWPTSSGSISTPRTTMYLSESGNRRDHEAKWGQKVRSHHVLSEPVPRARPNAHHPLTTSRAPDARCARCTPSPHPPLRALIGRLACRQEDSTSTGPRSSCTWSLPLIRAAETIYSATRCFGRKIFFRVGLA